MSSHHRHADAQRHVRAIPAELLGKIVEHASRADLFPLLLASRASQLEAERILYRSVTFPEHTGAKIDTFMSAVLQDDQKARLVTSLELPLAYPPKEWRHQELSGGATEILDRIAAGILALPNLKSLRFKPVDKAAGIWRNDSFIESLVRRLEGATFELRSYDDSSIMRGPLRRITTWAFLHSQSHVTSFSTSLALHWNALHGEALLFPSLHTADLPSSRWLEHIHCRHIRRLGLFVYSWLSVHDVADDIARCGHSLKHLKLAAETTTNLAELVRALSTHKELTIETLTLVCDQPTKLSSSGDLTAAVAQLGSVRTYILDDPLEATLTYSGFHDKERPTGKDLHWLDRLCLHILSSNVGDTRWITYRRNEEGHIVFEGESILNGSSWKTFT